MKPHAPLTLQPGGQVILPIARGGSTAVYQIGSESIQHGLDLIHDLDPRVEILLVLRNAGSIMDLFGLGGTTEASEKGHSSNACANDLVAVKVNYPLFVVDAVVGFFNSAKAD